MLILMNAYLVFLAFSMSALYVALRVLFPYFFQQRVAPLDATALRTVLGIVAAALLVFAASAAIPDIELGNRLLHAVGGGFLASMVSFLAARDSRIHITRFQLFVLIGLVVLALGIANELAEFVLQEYTDLVFAETITDTWLDLASNLAGIIVATFCSALFLKSIAEPR
jgi:hypothetical protein